MIIKTIDELHQHIGVIGDNDIKILSPFLKRAKRYLIQFIGLETYIVALNHYLSDDYRNVNDDNYDSVSNESEILDNLVDKIQDSIVYYAHYLYAPEANVIMTDNGFRVPWSDSVRPAQEWQINKAEASILDTSYEMIDQLIEFLDENVESIESWDASDEIQKSKALFINSAKEFSKYFSIKNSGRIFLMLKPIIAEIERKQILPIINEIRFNEIHDQIIDGNVLYQNQLILDRINPALVFFTMYTALIRIPKEEFSSISNYDIKNLHETAIIERQTLENYITKLNNISLPDDEKQSETYQPLNFSDEDLENKKSISL